LRGASDPVQQNSFIVAMRDGGVQISVKRTVVAETVYVEMNAKLAYRCKRGVDG
jgi:hypothetical protein